MEAAPSMLDIRPRVDVQESEYLRLLGYPRNFELGGRARELADAAVTWYAENGRPWVFARRSEALEIVEGGFRVDGVEFRSEYVRRQIEEAGAQAAMLVAVSAGAECETYAQQLWREEKPDEYFFLEVFGSAVVENLVTSTGARFCAEADLLGEAVLPHYSPGYPEWAIEEQSRFLELIQPRDPEGVSARIEALETGMLRPKKSLLAVFPLTRHVDRVERLTDLVPCTRCPLAGCRYRRRPYKYAAGRRGEVESLQRRASRTTNGKARTGITLNHAAPYTVGAKALRKWSAERLQLTPREDGYLEALFRFEGTTCSNLGYPLKFDYRITLEPPERGYRILDAYCKPSPGDEGFTRMCKYLKDPDALMEAVEREKPLLGKSLDDVFEWNRKYSPTGCYCDAAGRAHKWGLALEVLHFALVLREQQAIEVQSEGSSSEFQP